MNRSQYSIIKLWVKNQALYTFLRYLVSLFKGREQTTIYAINEYYEQINYNKITILIILLDISSSPWTLLTLMGVCDLENKFQPALATYNLHQPPQTSPPPNQLRSAPATSNQLHPAPTSKNQYFKMDWCGDRR